LGEEAETLMPAYNCGSEVDPFIKPNENLELYRVDRDRQVNEPKAEVAYFPEVAREQNCLRIVILSDKCD